MPTESFSDFAGKATRALIDELTLSLTELEKLALLANEIYRAITQKKIVYFFGNGGSAAEATHIAAEFTSQCLKPHVPWAAVCLNDSVSALTAISNDFQFNDVFKRQVTGLVKQGDLVIGLSTSGKSPNVIAGLEEAVKLGAFAALFTSSRSPKSIDHKLNLVLRANAERTTRIQEIHLHWLHTIIEFIEVNLE